MVLCSSERCEGSRPIVTDPAFGFEHEGPQSYVTGLIFAILFVFFFLLGVFFSFFFFSWGGGRGVGRGGVSLKGAFGDNPILG